MTPANNRRIHAKACLTRRMKKRRAGRFLALELTATWARPTPHAVITAQRHELKPRIQGETPLAHDS
eukprot:1847811-Lingulodinium_polyedra.AAC.1